MKPHRKAFYWGASAGLILVGILILGGFGWDYLLGNVSIQFYGRVVDRNGHGVAGVVIKGKVTYIPLFNRPDPRLSNRERNVDVKTVTDADGRFAIHSHGVSLDLLDWEASGLVLSNNGGGVWSTFIYQTRGYPPMQIYDNPNHPYIYYMVPANPSKER